MQSDDKKGLTAFTAGPYQNNAFIKRICGPHD